jgi:V8-like Glu-specific endopeptidase
MTNEHCISSGSEARSAVAEFRYDSQAAEPTRYRGMALEAGDTALDYAVLRLRGNPSQHGRVRFTTSGPQSEGRRLAIIQHPAGEPKQASVADCKVSGLNRAGVGGTNTDFGHLCDTLGGSSGSPVFDWDSLRVVGLHHLGFRAGIDDPVNQAVRMQLIRAHVRQEKPNIAVEIWGAGP